MARILLALLLLAPAAQDSGDFPKRATLTRLKTKQPFLMNYALPEGVEAAKTPEARQATLGKTPVTFVDVDGNGSFGDVGVDGWTTGGPRYIVPLEELLVVGTDEVRLKFVDDVVTYRADPIKARREQLDALLKLNELRLRNGLVPATFDAALSEGCEKHCAYMLKHGMGHEEDPKKAGYTAEGQAAGAASCVNPGACADSVMAFYDSLYHRIPLMGPETRAFGIGSNGTYTAIDGLRARSPRLWMHPVVIPAPESEGHSPGFHAYGESPRPYPEGVSPGNPITVTLNRARVSGVTAELREGGARGRLLETLVSSPEKPANPARPDNSFSIGVMAKSRMRPRVVHHVKLAWKEDGAPVTLEWDFTTGS